MPVQFQESNDKTALNPLEVNNQNESQWGNPSGEGSKLPPGFMDPNNPTLEQTTKERRQSRQDRIADVEEPKFTWSKNEKNSFHRDLFSELEKNCTKIHPNLTFWKEDMDEGEEEPIYPDLEADWIIQDSQDLNQEQRDAVLAAKDDLILHALAGTGKTRSLSSMIAYLIALGNRPNKIGVSSHTVTAAQEIKSRVEPTIQALFPRINEYRGEGAYNWIQAGTIHALAYRELGRMHHPKSRHAIIEESAQIKIWREACQFSLADEYQADEESLFGEWMRLHERIRSMAIPEDAVPKVLKSITKSDRIPRIAETYRKIKEARDLIDYTDLLRLWCEILIHPGYAKRWKYFFVDEYQDTSPLQKFILKILRNHGTKVIVCGDIRQSITSFTGSDPAILNNLETLPGPTPAKELWLQTNYRCSLEIVTLANHILRNMFPEEKHRILAHSEAPVGDTPKIREIYGKGEEYRTTINEGLKLLESFEKEEKPNASVALLYRTNAQGSSLEEAIAELNSQRIKKGIKPITYARKDYRRTALRTRTERELSAILHAWCNPNKARWFEILTSPYFKGIGEVTANTITTKAARKKAKNIDDIWEIFEGEIPRKSLETVGRFLAAWERSAEGIEDEDALETLPTEQAVAELQGWISSVLETNGTSENDTVSKKDIEESQRRSYEAGFFDKILRFSKETLKTALQKMEDDTRKEGETEGHETPGGLILSTIHLSKGKEFDGVVLHNVSWFSLPHYNAIQQEELPDGVTERRWRKLCSLKSNGDEYNQGLLDKAIQNPEVILPKIVPYPKEASWGKSEAELKINREEKGTSAPNDSVAWDWMTNPIEEEKRLLYVGVTRARQKLTITTTSKKSHPFIPAEIWWDLVHGKSIAKEEYRVPPPPPPEDPF